MPELRFRFHSAILLASFALLTGCESESTGPEEELISGEVQIDASSNTAYTYFSLSTGQVVQVADPTTSSAWDLAIRRYEVRLNGGVAGPKDAAGFNLENNANATPEQILAFTPASQKAAFDAVGTAQIPAANLFIEEKLAANPLGWLAFGAQGPVANGSAWKVKRGANGGHSVFRATAITFSGAGQAAALATVTVEWRHQQPGGTLGAPQTTVVDVGAGTPAINLSTGAVSAATGCDWDIEFDAEELAILPNVACNVGTAPLDPTETFAAITTAATALEYGPFLAGRSGAIPYSAALADPKGPFLYNLAGDNRLSPTFNTYLVKVGSEVYKFQLTGYYGPTGTSGFPTIRFARIQ